MSRPGARDSQALVPRERLWTGIGISTTFGPLVVPPTAELRRAAAVLADAQPALRLDERLDLRASCWRQQGLGAVVAGEQAVVAWEGPGPREVGVVAHERAVQHLRPVEVPLRFVVADDHVTVLMSHAVGDATLAVAALAALLAVAAGAPVPAWMAAPRTDAPLRRALAQTYLRAPRQLLATARAARPLPTPSPDVRARPCRLVRPSPDAVHALVPRRVLAGTKVWRMTHARGAATTALHAVLVAEALAEVGLPPDGGPTVLFDARRYLPPGAVVHGNFVTGLQLDPRGPWTVEGLSRQVQLALDAARPLSAMAVGAGLAGVRGVLGSAVTSGAAAARVLRGAGTGEHPGAAATDTATGTAMDTTWWVPVHPRPVLAVSSVRNPALDRLPWAAPAGECAVAPLLTAAPATGVTALMTEVRGCLNVSLSFHGEVFDREVLQRAADLVAADPVRLLDRSLQRQVPQPRDGQEPTAAAAVPEPRREDAAPAAQPS